MPDLCEEQVAPLSETTKALQDQLLKVWDIYIKFYTVFLAINFTALGVVVKIDWAGNHGGKAVYSGS